MTATDPDWSTALGADAPDVVACWRALEAQRCRLEHPLIGHLRCGEWLLWIGVHDCMHLEQLHRVLETDAAAAGA